MQSLLSLMSKLSSISSHDVLDSEQEISKKAMIPSLKTPFENDKLKIRKEDESQQSVFKFDLSNQQLIITSPLLDNIPDSTIELDLSNNLLCEFPLQLKKCECLKFLNICNNQIVQLPIKFYLTNLEYLNLQENQIKNLPSGLFKLQFLRGLNLNNNYIDFLPSELFNLKLIQLSLKSNLFTTIPAKFQDIIETLQIFELDWFDYCAISYNLDFQIKQKLYQLCQRVIQRQEIITFSLFYYYMLGRVFDITNFNQYGKNILFTFISRDSTGLLKQYSQKYPELCKQYDEDNQCPILYAFNLRRNKCIQILLPYYDLNSFEIKSLFLLAVKRIDIKLVQILINFGIDVNIQIDRDIQGSNKIFIPQGSTAMHTVMTSFGRNAQQQQQAQTMVELLLDHKSDPNIRNPMKLTSLHVAVKLPSLAAVRFATQKPQFDFHKRDMYKNTTLHSAASQGLVSILQLIQAKNINPFYLNINNKTAKQVSISSLQIIKLSRKYEYFYLKKKLLQVNSDYHTNSKNENLISLNSNQTISQYQQGTEIRSQIQSPSQTQQRKIFRLNLSQVKLMEQNGLFSSRQQQQSSQRSVAPKINEILQKIQLILRQTNQSNQILIEFKKLYYDTEVLQEKLLIIIFTSLLLMKLKHGWKYLSTIATSTISILNQTKIIYEKPISIQNIFINECQQQVNKYKFYCSQMENIDDIQGIKFNQQKNQLSSNLIYNINNHWKETIIEQEDFYQNSLGEQQWINCIKGLKMQNQIKFSYSNRILLQQYEQFQNNQLAKTQFIRVIQKQMDYYKEQKVDNSESKGSLSDRISQYSNVLTVNKKPKLLQTLKYNKMEFYIKNKSQTQRRVSPQVIQHQGEKAQTFRESFWKSKEFSLDNL